MAQKDLAEKALESFNDVFADIINVFLFNGDSVIHEAELSDATPYSLYFADERLHAQERDIAKNWEQNCIHIARLNIENQTEDLFDMPVRVMSYDSASYRNQMNGRHKEENYQSVITLVLYFGYQHPWRKPRRLSECMQTPECLKPYVNDYPIQIAEIAYISDEQLGMFKSDFRYVADYLVQMRKNNNYEPSKEMIRHYCEVCHLLTEFTGDDRFASSGVELREAGKEEVSMCEVLDRIENRGIEKGKREGRAEGRAEGRFLFGLGLVRDGIISVEMAAERCGFSKEQFIILMDEEMEKEKVD